MEPDKIPEPPFQGLIGNNFFVLKGPITPLEEEALMNFETWSWWQHQWWRIRYRADKISNWYKRMRAKIEWIILRH